MYALQVMTVTEKHYSKWSVFAFGFKTRIKTILPLINRLTNEVLLGVECWPRFNQMLIQLIDIPHWFLINMFQRVAFSRCLQSRRWCTGMFFVQPGVKLNGAYHCDVLLLKQLLPDICQAAGDFYFPAHNACTRALNRCGLPTDQTSVLYVTAELNNRQSSLDILFTSYDIITT